VADASYWTYLVHLPILFAIQYPLMDVQLHWTFKFGIATLSTLGIAMVSYQWLVRRSFIGTLLNGPSHLARSVHKHQPARSA
jgi:peptidoglycan/LPS O-acetylase OafA/YrhL